MIKNYIDLPFLTVPTPLVAWENENSAHTHCAAVLAQLMHIYNHRSDLAIYAEDDYMMLTTDRILETMYYSMKNKKLTKCLQVLENDGLIERQEKRRGLQTIKLNHDSIGEVIKKYKNDDNKREYFLVYYVCFAYEQDRHPSSNVSYMLSMFMQMLQAQSFATNMSDAYLKMCLGDIFSTKQIKNMLSILHNDCFATVDNRSVHIGESYVARRHIFMHADAITEMITKYHRETTSTRSYQAIDLNASIPHKSVSADNAKSEMPNNDEMAVIRQRWAELEAQGKRVEY